MKINILSAAALSLALMSGAAFAQATSSTASDNPSQNTESDAVILGNKEKMATFYTDDTMATLRADTELQAAWQAMTPEDQTAFRADCEVLSKGGGGEPRTTDAGSSSNAQLWGEISAI